MALEYLKGSGFRVLAGPDLIAVAVDSKFTPNMYTDKSIFSYFTLLAMGFCEGHWGTFIVVASHCAPVVIGDGVD